MVAARRDARPRLDHDGVCRPRISVQEHGVPPGLGRRECRARGLDEIPIPLSEGEWAASSPQLRTCSTNLGIIPIQAVPSVYAAADAAIFPSLLEGFSAMPLEAMKVEKFVFASRRELISSVCRDGSVYIDPEDPTAADSAERYVGIIDSLGRES